MGRRGKQSLERIPHEIRQRPASSVHFPTHNRLSISPQPDCGTSQERAKPTVEMFASGTPLVFLS